MEIIQIILLLAILYFLVKSSKETPKGTQKERRPQLPARQGRKLVMDTCALIDGRILELARTGFVPEELVIPQFVLAELQGLADGHDAHKRERARFGLDVVKLLQDNGDCTVTIDRTAFETIREIDDKLVALAKKLGGQLYTTDFNLNKVAEIEGVRVLNVNNLAQHIRPVALPGEKKLVKILQKGSNRDQGVGYLEDGTMVVVDGAAKLLGKTVEIEISRTHQTVAGKMLFGQVMITPPKATVSRSNDQKLRQRLSPSRRRQ